LTNKSISQEDGGKKIELKPGFLMEHDESVYLCPFLFHITALMVVFYYFVSADNNTSRTFSSAFLWSLK
jgi:hypothetical protein